MLGILSITFFSNVFIFQELFSRFFVILQDLVFLSQECKLYLSENESTVYCLTFVVQ